MTEYEIHTGAWDNYSLFATKQYTFGARNGAALVGGLSTFLGIVGSCFWTIIAFIIYRARAKPGLQDGTHHYQQAIYRNTSSPIGVAWAIMTGSCVYSGREGWSKFWRKASPPVRPNSRLKRRCCCFGAILPLGIRAAFVAAGVGLPLVVTNPAFNSNQVLIEPRNCGFVVWNVTDTDDMAAFEDYTLRTANAALAYVNECYSPSASSLACSTLPTARIAYDAVTTDGCPFGKRCKSPTISLKTGWIDSHKDLGINAPKRDRLQIRKTTECAVIDVDDLIERTTVDNIQRYEYFLGPIQGLPIHGFGNYTAYVVERKKPDYVGYHVQGYFALQGQSNPWQPIPDLQSEDGDVALFIVQYGITAYLEKVDDPLYKATQFNQDMQLYEPDEPAGLFACVDRFQIQDPRGTQQTDLGSFTQVTNQVFKLDLTRAQFATAIRLTGSATKSSMYDAVTGLDAVALRAARKTALGISLGLADDQYQDDIRGMFETTLALFQQDIVAFAYTPDSTLRSSAVRANLNGVYTPAASSRDKGIVNVTDEIREMCRGQKLRNTAACQTFSAAWLWSILIVGLVVIVVSWIPDKITAACWQGRAWLRRNKPGVAEQEFDQRLWWWKMDGIAHLQRRAFDNAEKGEWLRCDDAIPMLAGRVDMSDLGYPERGPELEPEGSNVNILDKATSKNPAEATESSILPLNRPVDQPEQLSSPRTDGSSLRLVSESDVRNVGHVENARLEFH